MRAWFSRGGRGLPLRRESTAAGETAQQDTSEEGQVEMVTSQDTAIAAALTELGYHVRPGVEVARRRRRARRRTASSRSRDMLARGRRHAGSRPTDDVAQGRSAAVPDGEPMPLVVERDGKDASRCEVTPVSRRTASRWSASRLAAGATTSRSRCGQHRRRHRRAQRRPDVLPRHLRHPHPGSLTGGHDRRRHRHHRRRTARSARSAASSRRSPAPATPAPKLFLVPPDNCARRRSAPTTATCGWSKAATMHDAVAAVEGLGRPTPTPRCRPARTDS